MNFYHMLLMKGIYNMKSGFVAIIGRPNVGKSTIINAILDTKLSIVTSKSQTTRDTIKGIYNEKDYQIVFLDTPGIHKPIQELGKSMNKKAIDASNDVDGLIIVIDASETIGAGDSFIAENVRKDIPTFIVLNKIDLANINEVMKAKEGIEKLYPKAKIIETSAINDFNIDELLMSVKTCIKEGPQYYPLDMISDVDQIFRIKEIIRAQVLNCLREEVPHNIAIRLDDIKSKSESVLIIGSIIVARDSHKGIVIGEKGKMIKKIGSRARVELKELLHKRIYLELLVKVDKDWTNNPKALKKYGY